MSIVLDTIRLLPPPEGLDLDEIKTDAGLLQAIEREAAKIKKASSEGAPTSKDEIRLISFLAGEVRRRISALTPEQREEIKHIRRQAGHRERKRRIEEISAQVDIFIAEAEKPKAAISFGAGSELEIAIGAVWGELENDEEADEELMTLLKKVKDKFVEADKKMRLVRLPKF